MSISLQKNASVSLKKAGGEGLTNITLGVGWDVASGGILGGLFGGGGNSIDLDASCIAFDGNRQVVDTVWFQQLLSRDGSIRHSGDNLTGEGDGDDETIAIDLTRLPSNIETLVFTVNSFRGQTFDKVKNAFSRVVDSRARKELARYDISESGPHTGVVLAIVKRDGGEWTFKAIGERTTARTVKDITTLASQLI
ncbi:MULTISPECIES: TerD family protein [Asticcacaulis]|uniref:TerD family protein n=1 Tax=Asticcacaulis TaxID=76890 RepID=UPI001AEB9231|nr:MULTISPECIES: TerD family protein [Asticcacaulis]MBP2157813.1 tellurium resistance protein TerZ [Asticcacaulis solisilvae]MDR6798858.1 tellurium resistance protein TerZ [Asticcacaulis sp. BE141]